MDDPDVAATMVRKLRADAISWRWREKAKQMMENGGYPVLEGDEVVLTTFSSVGVQASLLGEETIDAETQRIVIERNASQPDHPIWQRVRDSLSQPFDLD